MLKSAGEAFVDFALADGSATASVDYEVQAGTLVFADGDFSQQVEPRGDQDRLALAVGGRVYRTYREVLDSDRWQRLEGAGARPQRLLWASTSTKDPEASDTLYVSGLAAPNTVNTMPDGTLEALGKHDAIYLGAVGTPAVPPGVIERGLLLSDIDFEQQQQQAQQCSPEYPPFRAELGKLALFVLVKHLTRVGHEQRVTRVVAAAIALVALLLIARRRFDGWPLYASGLFVIVNFYYVFFSRSGLFGRRGFSRRVFSLGGFLGRGGFGRRLFNLGRLLGRGGFDSGLFGRSFLGVFRVCDLLWAMSGEGRLGTPTMGWGSYPDVDAAAKAAILATIGFGARNRVCHRVSVGGIATVSRKALRRQATNVLD